MVLGLHLILSSLLLAISAQNAFGVIIYLDMDDLNQFPFLLQLRDKNGAFLCAATLIHPKYAITAAECFNKLDYTEVTVVAMAPKVTDPGMQRKVTKIYKYPKKIINIAIVKLNEPLDDIDVLPLIDRPITEEEDEYENLRVMGWRHMSHRMSIKKTLQTTRLYTTAYNDCETAFFAADVKKIFCLSGHNEHNWEVCCTDVGSPAFTDGKLYGVVSKSYNCGSPQYLLSVTSVFEVLPFIEDIISEVV